MTFYDVLDVPADATAEEIEQAVQRQRSVLADGAVYPNVETIQSEQLRQNRQELVEEAAQVLLDSTSKAAYDTFLEELGEVAGHLEYLRWRKHPAHDSLSPVEWVDRYGDAQTCTAEIEKTQVLSSPGAPDGDTNHDAVSNEQTNPPNTTADQGVFTRAHKLLQTAVQIGLGLLLLLFEPVYRGLANLLRVVVDSVMIVITALRYSLPPLSIRGAGAAAIAFPFVLVGIEYGTLALEDAVPGIASQVVIAVGLLLAVLVHLVYILTPRAGIPVFGLLAVGGYFASGDESTLFIYIYIPCFVFAVIVFVLLPR